MFCSWFGAYCHWSGCDMMPDLAIHWGSDAFFVGEYDQFYSHTISFRWSGLIRGAVSVALVYYYFDPNGKTQDAKNSSLITTTLLEVMTSIFVFGAATKPLLDSLLGSQGTFFAENFPKPEPPCYIPAIASTLSTFTVDSMVQECVCFKASSWSKLWVKLHKCQNLVLGLGELGTKSVVMFVGHSL